MANRVQVSGQGRVLENERPTRAPAREQSSTLMARLPFAARR